MREISHADARHQGRIINPSQLGGNAAPLFT
jgi:hypothetical protein